MTFCFCCLHPGPPLPVRPRRRRRHRQRCWAEVAAGAGDHRNLLSSVSFGSRRCEAVLSPGSGLSSTRSSRVQEQAAASERLCRFLAPPPAAGMPPRSMFFFVCCLQAQAAAFPDVCELVMKEGLAGAHQGSWRFPGARRALLTPPVALAAAGRPAALQHCGCVSITAGVVSLTKQQQSDMKRARRVPLPTLAPLPSPAARRQRAGACRLPAARSAREPGCLSPSPSRRAAVSPPRRPSRWAVLSAVPHTAARASGLHGWAAFCAEPYTAATLGACRKAGTAAGAAGAAGAPAGPAFSGGLLASAPGAPKPMVVSPPPPPAGVGGQ